MMLIGARPLCDNEIVFVSPEAVLTVRVPLWELVLVFAVAVTLTELPPVPELLSNVTQLGFAIVLTVLTVHTNLKAL